LSKVERMDFTAFRYFGVTAHCSPTGGSRAWNS
jgi:hypothetical protein